MIENNTEALFTEALFSEETGRIRKVIHMGDLHIPKYDSGKRYSRMLKNTLKMIYENEIGENGDPNECCIVICGDIFHDKIRITNEQRVLFNEFMNWCNELCKTIVIAGNHDMLENNLDRMDSITPSFTSDNVYDNITYLDKELGYKSDYIIDEEGKVIWVLYSIFDKHAPVDIKHSDYPDYKIIGLYHGDIKGSVTDSGNISDSGINPDIYSECDCVMAGHIHKHQEIKKNGVPLVYSGSLFQQNKGENVTGHGYVVWDLEDMTYRHVEVPNPYSIFRIKLTSYDDVENDVEELVNL